jgi:hypothetical protein
MTTEQFNDLVRDDIKRMVARYGRLYHFIFEWDSPTGFSSDRVNYGPIDVTASSWIVPGSIEEEEPEPEEDEPEEEPREYEYEDRYDYFDRSYEKGEW